MLNPETPKKMLGFRTVLLLYRTLPKDVKSPLCGCYVHIFPPYMLEIVQSQVPSSISVPVADGPYRQLKNSVQLQAFFHLITGTNNILLKIPAILLNLAVRKLELVSVKNIWSARKTNLGCSGSSIATNLQLLMGVDSFRALSFFSTSALSPV